MIMKNKSGSGLHVDLTSATPQAGWMKKKCSNHSTLIAFLCSNGIDYVTNRGIQGTMVLCEIA